MILLKIWFFVVFLMNTAPSFCRDIAQGPNESKKKTPPEIKIIRPNYLAWGKQRRMGKIHSTNDHILKLDWNNFKFSEVKVDSSKDPLKGVKQYGNKLFVLNGASIDVKEIVGQEITHAMTLSSAEGEVGGFYDITLYDDYYFTLSQHYISIYNNEGKLIKTHPLDITVSKGTIDSVDGRLVYTTFPYHSEAIFDSKYYSGEIDFTDGPGDTWASAFFIDIENKKLPVTFMSKGISSTCGGYRMDSLSKGAPTFRYTSGMLRYLISNLSDYIDSSELSYSEESDSFFGGSSRKIYYPKEVISLLQYYPGEKGIGIFSIYSNISKKSFQVITELSGDDESYYFKNKFKLKTEIHSDRYYHSAQYPYFFWKEYKDNKLHLIDVRNGEKFTFLEV